MWQCYFALGSHIKTPPETVYQKSCLKYMIYYNRYRYQWNLMTPIQYRDHLLKSA
ncbi:MULTISPECIES: IS3 family transposase [Bacillales]|uniref:IS3 family transposase n=1 Tax=Sporosarcina contaminans TaxID=633403 RepID=A0ABW3TWU0_9BACL|nr:IS3 family transposase [Siminovitchia thermophila]